MDEKTFAAICYLVLMDHHGEGYGSAHPSYVREKLAMLEMGWDAYGLLDRENQLKVLNHLESWEYEWPEEIKKYESQTYKP